VWAATRSVGSETEGVITIRFNHIRKRKSRPIYLSHKTTTALSGRPRTPGFLRHSPIDAVEKVSHLSGADCHHAGGDGRPKEVAPLQSLPRAAGSPSSFAFVLRRQAKIRLGAIPCLRATSDTFAPAADVSAAILVLSSADQWRRCLPFAKISTRIDLLNLSAHLRSHASPIAPNNQGGPQRRRTYSPTYRRRSKDRNNRRACSWAEGPWPHSAIGTTRSTQHDPIHNFAHIDLALAVTMFGRVDQRFDRFRHARENTAANTLRGDLSQPALDEVQPR
jgi:hypothetical protein